MVSNINQQKNKAHANREAGSHIQNLPAINNNSKDRQKKVVFYCTFSVSFTIIDSTAAESADDLYVASSVRIATAVSIFTDEKSPWSSC